MDWNTFCELCVELQPHAVPYVNGAWTIILVILTVVRWLRRPVELSAIAANLLGSMEESRAWSLNGRLIKRNNTQLGLNGADKFSVYVLANTIAKEGREQEQDISVHLSKRERKLLQRRYQKIHTLLTDLKLRAERESLCRLLG